MNDILGSANRPKVAEPIVDEEDSDLMMSVLGADEDDDLADDDDDLIGVDDDIFDEDEDGDDDLPDDDTDLVEVALGGVEDELHPVDAKSEGQMPIFDPIHNLREVAKQLLMLEDHLAHPAKHCPDCIRKHLLAAEGLAEEAVTLDKTGEHQAVLQGLPMQIRQLSKGFLKSGSKPELMQQAREIRKRLSKISFGSVLGKETPAPQTPPAKEPAIEDNSSAYAKLTPELVAQAREEFRENPLVRSVGQGGHDGQVIVVYVADKGVKIPSTWRGFEVTSRVAGSPRLFGKKRFGEDAAMAPGTRVIFKYFPPQGEVGYRRGVLAHGTAQPDAEGRYTILSGSDKFQVKPQLLYVEPSRPISSLLRGKSIVKYDNQGVQFKPFQLSDQRLIVADAIQAVFLELLKNGCSDIGVEFGFSFGEDAGSESLRATACRKTVPGKVFAGALVNAIYESTLNPLAINPNEPSVGLWQLNLNGAGAGMTVLERQDIRVSTERIIEELKSRADSPRFRAIVQREISAAIAGTPQNAPSVGEYAAFWCAEIERPADPELSAKYRGMTANLLFDNRPPSMAPQAVTRVPEAPVMLPARPASKSSVGVMDVILAGFGVALGVTLVSSLSRVSRPMPSFNKSEEEIDFLPLDLEV